MMALATMTLRPAQHPSNRTGGNAAPVSEQLLEKARVDTATVLTQLESRLDGLSQPEVASRLQQYGLNEIAREKHQSARKAGPSSNEGTPTAPFDSANFHCSRSNMRHGSQSYAQ